MDKALLTITEASEYIGVGRTTLYSLLQPRGPIVLVKVGKASRVPKVALDQWIAEQMGERAPTSAA